MRPLIRRHSKLVLLAVCCTALGAAGSAIATAGAAGGASPSRVTAHRVRRAGLFRLARRAVQGQLVVPTRSGFVKVSFLRGRVESVDGRRLTVNERTKRTSYRTVTINIPANARVRNNRRRADLSSLTSGQRVIVLHAPRRTFVIAHTARTG